MYRIIFLFLITQSSICLAQNYCKYKPKITVNPNDYGLVFITHGTTLSAPDFIIPKSNGTLLNLGFGAYIRKRIVRNEFLRIEISFVQKGSRYNFKSEAVLRLNYIEIPVFWSHCYHVRKITFYLECGLAYSMLILSSKQIKLYSEQSSNPDASNFKNYDVPIIFAWLAPLNPHGKNNIEIGLRYSYSPLSIHKTFKTESMAMFEDDGIHPMTYGIQFAYKFR
jgi:hypothetical protein